LALERSSVSNCSCSSWYAVDISCNTSASCAYPYFPILNPSCLGRGDTCNNCCHKFNIVGTVLLCNKDVIILSEIYIMVLDPSLLQSVDNPLNLYAIVDTHLTMLYNEIRNSDDVPYPERYRRLKIIKHVLDLLGLVTDDTEFQVEEDEGLRLISFDLDGYNILIEEGMSKNKTYLLVGVDGNGVSTDIIITHLDEERYSVGVTYDDEDFNVHYRLAG